MNNRMTFTFQSISENVTIARMLASALGAQLNFPLNELEELKVAVSEAVSNAIIHGYQNAPAEFVTMEIETTSEKVMILVSDSGCGIADIDQAMQASYSTDPERMGLGFVFMKSFMDELNVESEVGKGTKVKLVKYLASHRSSSH
ncbi:anti-sigma regulatory factor, serine/threonine protein kinase [Syntrophobotulus glycolicus DSM 8271]|uniref:Anti-sigma F factor n=1 Tax=Syntrophobotulus glycolicus (strain DSM 8271 / FlGlyR) TaxID=645991 RepID=F0T074_SYNGF|nr:anti-sigma F factor [Syntrophobotulus glycolicus]ADY56161.1 anti-sigma regulatory factor, serine/threonine protein kinase [Syntrophobotulus glycolicus DSM 8271]